MPTGKKTLRTLTAIFAAVCSLTIGATTAPAKDISTANLHKISFENKDDTPLTLQDFKGNVTLLAVWSTWCPTCAQELPVLNQLQQRYRALGLKVVAVAGENKKEDAADYLKRKNLVALDLYTDPTTTIIDNLKMNTYPTHVLLDRKGKVLYAGSGGIDWLDDAHYLKLIEDALTPPTETASATTKTTAAK